MIVGERFVEARMLRLSSSLSTAVAPSGSGWFGSMRVKASRQVGRPTAGPVAAVPAGQSRCVGRTGSVGVRLPGRPVSDCGPIRQPGQDSSAQRRPWPHPVKSCLAFRTSS